MLFIKDLNQDDSGDYICRGTYANNEEMESKVTIATFSKFLNYLTNYFLRELNDILDHLNERFHFFINSWHHMGRCSRGSVCCHS